MNRIAKKRMAKAIVTEETKKSKPAGLALQEQERDVVWAVLILLAANEINREEAASFLHDWIEKEGALWHELGLRQGHAIAEGLTKRKPPHRAIRKIVRVQMENPKATTEEVFRALDKAHIPLYKSKSMPDAEDWQDVIKVPYYKNFVSRIRKQVARASRLRELQREMTLREMQDGVQRHTLV